jgi:hypothetical protein
MRKLLISSAAVAAIATTIWLIRRTPPPMAANETSSENGEKDSSSDEWRHELAQMRRELVRLAWNQRASAGTAARDPAGEEPSEPEPEHDEVSAMPPMSGAEQRAAQTDLLVEQMHREGIDPVWKRDAEAQIRERLAEQPMTGAIRTDIECRASLCRLDVIVESVDVRDDAVAALPLIVPWSFEGYYRAADDDEQHVIVYVTREGATLPRLAMTPDDAVDPGANRR